MIFSEVYPDVGVVYGWANYHRPVMPKTPGVQLLLAAVIERDMKSHEETLEKWDFIGWYPSCHGGLSPQLGGYNVRLYAKKKRVLAPFLLPEGIKESYCYPLSCSVSVQSTFNVGGSPFGYIGYYNHAIIGLRRIPLKDSPQKVDVPGWKKFATTKLATYWFWGLEPGERNVYKLEPGHEKVELTEIEKQKRSKLSVIL